MPQNAAGTRTEPPKSVPCASGSMPVATATAEPPDEPAGLNFGFHGLRVAPNTALTVLAPAANSGVLVLPSTMAPAALSRRTDFGVFARHEILEQGRAEGGANAGGQRDVLDADRQAVQRPDRIAAHDRLLRRDRGGACLLGHQRHDGIELRVEPFDHRQMGVKHAPPG